MVLMVRREIFEPALMTFFILLAVILSNFLGLKLFHLDFLVAFLVARDLVGISNHTKYNHFRMFQEYQEGQIWI